MCNMEVEDQEHFLLHCTSLRIPRAALWAEISERNPDFISYDSTAKLAYLLHPTELVFTIAKGIRKLYIRYTLLYHSHWYFLLSYIFSPFTFFVVAVVCLFFVVLIMSCTPHYCPVHVMLFSTPQPPPPQPSTLLLPSCIYTCYAHTSLAHTYTVVTMHTHTQPGQFYVPCTPCTLLYHCHTLHAHAFSLCLLNSHNVCCPDLLRVPCVPCYVYIHRDTYALNM